MNLSALDAILSILVSIYKYWKKILEENLHMLALTGKPLKGLQSFTRMIHAKKLH